MEDWKKCVARLSLGKTSDVRMSRRGSEDGGGEREWRANWTVDLNRKKSILLCLIGCTQAKM
jgi:hypothetical protein